LTDEYLRAAQFCGGLTKWDVLRLAKAGFKNAFLAKDDVAAMLRHVEYEVFRILSEQTGESDFPQVDGFCPAPLISLTTPDISSEVPTPAEGDGLRLLSDEPA
jgi:hypothetical protein